jgi:hypothetical protein
MTLEQKIRAWLETRFPDGGYILEGDHTLVWVDYELEYRPGLHEIIREVTAE